MPTGNTLLAIRVICKAKCYHPVVQVSWFEALEFVKWLNRTYRSVLSSGLAFRLPSEAEWEKAARGIEARKYAWGNRLPSPELGMEVCNIHDTGIGDTTPVGKYSPDGDSPYGCADMTGNVLRVDAFFVEKRNRKTGICLSL